MISDRKRKKGYSPSSGHMVPDQEEREISSESQHKRPRSVRDCALTLLEYRDRTEQEMRSKLKEREYSPEEIEETIAFLIEYHYIDDGEYARRYVRTHANRKSIRRIRGELEQRGVRREWIEEGLAEVPVDEEAQIAAWIRKKGCIPGEHLEADQYRRLMAGLGRRGYSYDAIRRVMDGD